MRSSRLGRFAAGLRGRWLAARRSTTRVVRAARPQPGHRPAALAVRLTVAGAAMGFAAVAAIDTIQPQTTIQTVAHQLPQPPAPPATSVAVAKGQTAKLNLTALPADMRGHIALISQEWGLDQQRATRIVQAAHDIGWLEPELILGLIAQESHFNSQARSYAGAVGLTQVIPRWHPRIMARIGGASQLNVPEKSVIAGALVLKKYIRETGNVVSALEKYSGGADNYAAKVLAYANKFRRVTEKQRPKPASFANGSRRLG